MRRQQRQRQDELIAFTPSHGENIIAFASIHDVRPAVMESGHGMSQHNEHRHNVTTQDKVKATAGMTANGADEGRERERERTKRTKRKENSRE